MSQTTEESGARAITADLMARLRATYLGPGPMPGAVVVEEVGQNGGWGQGSRCDAIAIGFTSASGRLMIGHEVKATRSDWLRELAKNGKADTWADECHSWYVVAPPGVVLQRELPADWGLMQPAVRGKKLTIVKQAGHHPECRPSWDAVRSIIARLDTLHRSALVMADVEAREQARSEVDRQVEVRTALRLAEVGDGQVYRERWEQLLSTLGVVLIDGRGFRWRQDGRSVTAEHLAAIGAAARRLGDADQALAEVAEGRRRLGYSLAEATKCFQAATAVLDGLPSLDGKEV